MEMSAELHSPAALSPGEELPVPILQELGGSQSRFGLRGEDKNLLEWT
jgi:hypothetical protein